MKLTKSSIIKVTEAGIFISNSMHKPNVSETNLDCCDLSHKISKKYRSDICEDIIILNVK